MEFMILDLHKNNVLDGRILRRPFFVVFVCVEGKNLAVHHIRPTNNVCVSNEHVVIVLSRDRA